MLAAAWLSERAGTPAVRERTRADAVTGAAVVLALYAVTALLNDAPTTVSVVLVGAIAVAVWAWWDPSPGALAVAAGAAVLGPLAEIAVVAAGAASYGDPVDGLAGVAPVAALPVLRGGRRGRPAVGGHARSRPAVRPQRVPTATRYSFSNRACSGVPRFHSSQNSSSARSNSPSRPSFSAFALAAIVGP